MLRIAAFTFFIVLVQLSFAQNGKNSNSKNIQDTVKVNDLNAKAIEFITEGSSNGEVYARKALKLAQKIKFTSGEIQALINISTNYLKVKENLDSSLYYLELARLKSNPKKHTKLYADIFRKIGTVYMYKGNSDSALAYLQKALPLFEKINDSVEVIRVVNNIGFTHFNREEYDKALKQFFKSLRFNETKNDSVFISYDYNNIAAALKNQNDFEGARSYFAKAMNIRVARKDSVGIAEVYNNLGNVYLIEKKYNSAIGEYEKGLKFINREKNKSLYLKFMNNLANSYGNLNQPQKEISYYKEVIVLLNEIGKSDGLSDIYMNIASCYYTLKDYPKSLENYKTALKFAKKEGQLHTQRYIYKALSKCYIQLNQNDLALEAIDDFVLINDSINGINSQKEVQTLKIQYETEKKEQELEDEKLKSAQEKQKFNLYITILIIALLGLIFLVMFLRNRHKHKTEILIRERNELVLSKVLETEEKERTRIAKDLHDGIVQDLVAIKHQLNKAVDLDPNESKENVKSIALDIERAGNELRDISYQMMPLTLKEYGLEKALDALLQKTCSALNISYDFELINVHKTLEEKIEVSIYRICQELINNSVKHSQASHIGLLIQGKGDHLQIIYEDNGVGFDANSITKGIGLNSLDSRIELIKGSFTIDSEISKGVTAYIRIPL